MKNIFYCINYNTCEQFFSTCYTDFNLNLAVNKYRRVSCKVPPPFLRSPLCKYSMQVLFFSDFFLFWGGDLKYLQVLFLQLLFLQVLFFSLEKSIFLLISPNFRLRRYFWRLRRFRRRLRRYGCACGAL